ncbi:MAG: phosphatidylglycerophosphatase A [Cellvibrionales bacterium]|nr:phosphatidylglycerophosphatase A [Cellvibrionales bacterium]
MKETPLFNLKNPVHLLATGFGSGLSPFAPGTVGTIAAIPLFYLSLMLIPAHYYWVFILVTAIAGIYICGQTAKDIGVHDHGSIVFDEFVGLWITLYGIAYYAADPKHWISLPNHWVWVLVGFLFFRFFDIIKPFPIGLLDKYAKGGFGIMIDDIIAGIYALLLLKLTTSLFVYFRASLAL